ncbi:hypothetical protein Tco_1316459 [Tanacetum coccineum]
MSTQLNILTDSQMHKYYGSWCSKEASPTVGNRTSYLTVEAAENILPVAAHEEVETNTQMTRNKLYFQAEKESYFLDSDWY